VKLLINNTNSLKGGSLQVALSYIRAFINIPENEYHIFMGPEVDTQINVRDFPSNFHFYKFRYHPSSVIHRFKTIRLLRNLEKKIKPDCVFTPFGPSYWTPISPHLVGFARGYYLYPDSPFFTITGLPMKVKIRLLKKLHRCFFRKNSQYYTVESDDAKKRLSLFIHKDLSNIHVISNTYHPVFNLPVNSNKNILPQKKNNEIRLLALSAYYSHKNLEIIPRVIDILNKQNDYSFVFILTIDHKVFSKKFTKWKNNLVNLGPVPIALCPKLYQESDMLFLPTLIEIFTAAYPEAMKTKKLIITSDLSFSREICGDAAEYFNPLNPEDIAAKIIRVARDSKHRKALIRKGEKRLLLFETPESRTKKLLEICAKISGTRRNKAN